MASVQLAWPQALSHSSIAQDCPLRVVVEATRFCWLARPQPRRSRHRVASDPFNDGSFPALPRRAQPHEIRSASDQHLYLVIAELPAARSQIPELAGPPGPPGPLRRTIWSPVRSGLTPRMIVMMMSCVLWCTACRRRAERQRSIRTSDPPSRFHVFVRPKGKRTARLPFGLFLLPFAGGLGHVLLPRPPRLFLGFASPPSVIGTHLSPPHEHGRLGLGQ